MCKILTLMRKKKPINFLLAKSVKKDSKATNSDGDIAINSEMKHT